MFLRSAELYLFFGTLVLCAALKDIWMKDITICMICKSVTKYKCSIIQTEQNTTDVDKIQIEQNAKFQNTNTTEYKRTKYKWSKYKCNKIQMQQNTNWTKHK